MLSRFSRLVCDPNRDPAEESFVVEEIEGHRLSFNRGIDAAERARRAQRYTEPYHAAIDALLTARAGAGAPALCAIHSFTPVWRARPRAMEVGVLYDAHAEAAGRLADALGGEGFVTAHNEPYSGFEGLIHAAHRHGRAHGLRYVELEVRNDLIATPEHADALAERIARALEVWVA